MTIQTIHRIHIVIIPETLERFCLRHVEHFLLSNPFTQQAIQKAFDNVLCSFTADFNSEHEAELANEFIRSELASKYGLELI